MKTSAKILWRCRAPQRIAGGMELMVKEPPPRRGFANLRGEAAAESKLFRRGLYYLPRVFCHCEKKLYC
jgi:hypothetical protein